MRRQCNWQFVSLQARQVAQQKSERKAGFLSSITRLYSMICSVLLIDLKVKNVRSRSWNQVVDIEKSKSRNRNQDVEIDKSKLRSWVQEVKIKLSKFNSLIEWKC